MRCFLKNNWISTLEEYRSGRVLSIGLNEPLLGGEDCPFTHCTSNGGCGNILFGKTLLVNSYRTGRTAVG
jgi:hypothetical protein